MQKQSESGQLPGSIFFRRTKDTDVKKGVPVTGNALFHVRKLRFWRSGLEVILETGAPVILGLVMGFFCSPAYSDDGLQEINALAKSGAPGLALQVLDRHQPDPKTHTKEWIEWERRRIDLYAQQKDWSTSINRLNSLQQQYSQGGLPELSRSFLYWIQEQKVNAYIENRKGEQALEILRALIWGRDKEAGPEALLEENKKTFSHWRRLVIRAYLSLGLDNDAYIAMLRYQQDYQNKDQEWNLLRARVMLQADRAEEAAQLMSSDASPEGRSLYYLASLKSNKTRPDKIYKKSSVLANRKTTPDDIRQQLWVVAATAAQQEEDWRSAIEALSHVLVLKEKEGEASDVIDTGLFSVSGRQLWSAYFKLGKQLGNQAHLLMGNDRQWLDASEQWLKKGERQNARAMMVVLARQSNDAEVRSQAHEKFADQLLKRKHGLTLLRRLYLDEEKGGGLGASSSVVSDQLPDTLRYMLIDDALSRSDISTASQLMGTQVAPPEGVDALLWELRRARILVMGSKHDKGVQVLHGILENNPVMSDQQLDRYVQVLFDLQTIGAHKEVIMLLERLPVDKDSQRYREVLFWMADSNSALKQYQESARQYLQSATLLGENNMDPWAQTARYQAADMLVKAGLREDAKRIYQRLLDVTKDPARRAAIQNRIQKLWLKPVEGLKSVQPQQAEVVAEPENASVQPLSHPLVQPSTQPLAHPVSQ